MNSGSDAAATQQAFFKRMDGIQQVKLLFDHLPGLHFFIKDEKSRMITSSKEIMERLGVDDEEKIVGKTDYDFFPQEIADNFVRDDVQVLKTGQPLINRVEIWYNEQRVLDWFVTTKLPIRDPEGNVIGIMGTTQTYEGKRRALLPFSSVGKAVELIRTDLHRNISAQEMARTAGLSVRQLSRKFREVFGMSPHEFALRTRIQGACDELARTEKPIIQIALDFGFCDQSAFTVQFRKFTGVTPRMFRERYRPLRVGM